MKEAKNPLVQVSERTIKSLLNFTAYELGLRIKKHGDKSFASNHEGSGVVTEEYLELMEAIKSNNNMRIVEEAADLAIACLWLVATRIEKDQIPLCTCGHTHYCASSDLCDCPGVEEKKREP